MFILVPPWRHLAVSVLTGRAPPYRVSSPAVGKLGRLSIDQRIALRATVLASMLGFLCTVAAAQAQTQAVVPHAARSRVETSSAPGECPILFLGYVGALEPANNPHSGVIRIRRELQDGNYPDVCANSFSPYIWTEGRDWLLRHFPSHPGRLTTTELQNSPKVILVGHSMGGWAILSVARDLKARGIPVELTVQVDSVGITDFTVPANVRSAAVFHANDELMLLTTKHVRLEDSHQTRLLEDVKVAGVSHQSITRDPRIRQVVLDTIDELRTAIATTGPRQAAHSTASRMVGNPN